MYLEDGGGRQALAFEPGVEAFDVLGREPVETMLAESGNDAVADLRRVGAVQSGPPDTAWRDGCQPGFHPLRNRDRPACARSVTALAGAFQLANLAGNLGLSPCLAVPAIGCPIILDAKLARSTLRQSATLLRPSFASTTCLAVDGHARPLSATCTTR